MAGVDVNASAGAAFDGRSLNALKLNASKDQSPETLKAVAKQFEAIMMNMMLKSMREASQGEGIFDNEQTKTFTSMLDQQLTQEMSSKGLGLADVLVRQLSKHLPDQGKDKALKNLSSIPGLSPDTANMIAKSINQVKSKVDDYADSVVSGMKKQAGEITASLFKSKVEESANIASAKTGIPSSFMIGQAALESGWGKREIEHKDGSTSHNLFGIKATSGWKGKTVDTVTTEYINGVKQKRVETFRSYDSYAEAFQDFANLITGNPRYKSAIASLSNVDDYAKGIQRGGYATDPHYAAKLASVIKKIQSIS